MPPDEAQAHDGYVQRYLASGEAKAIGHRRKLQGRRRDGTLFPIEITVADTTAGSDVAFTAFVRDLTESTEHEQRFQLLVDVLPDGVVIHRDGRIVYANHALVTMLRWTGVNEMIGKHVLDVMVHPDEREQVARRIAQERSLKRWPIMTMTALRADGTVTTLEATAINTLFQGVASNIVVLRDVGEREQLRLRIAHAERMASVGTLAAGIGHEINNPLTYILGNLEFGLTELQDIAGTLAVCAHATARRRLG